MGKVERETYTLEEVDYELGGVYALDDEFRSILDRSLSKLPKNTVDWAIRKLFFVSSSEEYWAFLLSKSEWGHKTGFIFLSEQLKDETEEKQAFTIAHEIAHHKLKHKSPFFGKITKEQARKNEEEADERARTWLSYPSNFKQITSKYRT